MDERLQNIDKLYKKVFQQHRELPSPKVWEHLEKELQKNNVTSITKKYRRWKWVAAALFILLTGLAMYTFHLTAHYKHTLKEAVTANRNSAPALQKNNTTKQAVAVLGLKASDSSTKVLNDQQRNRNISALARKDRKIQHLPASPILINESNNARSKIVYGRAADKNNRETITSKVSTSYNASNKSKPNYTAETDVKGLAYKKADSNITTLDEKINNSEGVTQLLKQSDETVTKDKLDKRSSDIILSQKQNDTSNNYLPISKGLADKTNQVPIDTSISSSGSVTMPKQIKSAQTTGHETVPVAQNKKQNVNATIYKGKYAVSVFYNNAFVSTTIQPNKPDYKEDQYEQIKNHEKYRGANTFGINLTRYFGQHFGIEAGAGKTILTTDISNKTLVARRDYSGKVSYRLSTSAGYAYYSIKNRPNPAFADSLPTLSSKNTLKYFSVPIGLQYRGYIGRLVVNPAFLISANFLTSAKITTIQSLEHTYTSELQGLKKHYIDGMLRLGLGYYITRRIGIDVIGSTRMSLSDPTEGKPVATHRKSLGIAAGLNYNF